MKHILILFSLISTLSFSQKKEYSFDYFLEYEIIFHKQNYTESKYYLTNSRDNSYLGILMESDSLHYELVLRHHGKAYTKVKLLKSDFYKAEFLNIACKDVVYNTKKYKIKDNILETTRDTLIDGTSYFLHKIELKDKPKKERKKKGLITKYYILNKNASFYLPQFEDIHDYMRWSIYKSMPNGIYSQQIQVDLFNQPHASEILQSYYKINKRIVITGECPEPIKFKSHF